MTPENKKRLALPVGIVTLFASVVFFLFREDASDTIMSFVTAVSGVVLLIAYKNNANNDFTTKPTHKTSILVRYAAWVGAVLGAAIGGYKAYEQGISVGLSIIISVIAFAVTLSIALFIIRKSLPLPPKKGHKGIFT